MNKRTWLTSKNSNHSKAITPPSHFLKLFITAVFALALAFGAWAAAPQQAFAATSTQEMYRLYNPYSGEHLYTLNVNEYNSLAQIGWRKEGVAWTCPKTSSTPVYRLYNPYSGDHHYTTDKTEYDKLGKIGWNKEGIGFYSANASNGVAVYRLFNRYVTVGTHHYTKDANEYNSLGKGGWNKEGIAWYGLSSGSTTNPTSPTSPTSPTTPTTPGTKTYTVYFSLPSVGGAALKDASLQKQTLKVGETPKDPGLTFSDATYRFDGWSKTLNEVAEASKKGTTWFNLSATYHRYTQYDYEVYLVSDKEFLSTPVATEFDNGSGNEGMQQYSYPLFIKTNNPNSDIQLDVLDSEGNSVVEHRYEANYGFTQYNDDRFSYGYHDTYCDIVYADNNAKASLQKNKVDGGFVYDLRIKKAGTYTLKITEESYSVGRLVYRIQGPSFTITVKDWTEAENAWIDAQIAKYTSSTMNSNEKLAAIAKGLNNDFSYLTYSYIGGMKRRVAYTTDVGAYFQNYHWDSLVSPTVLCKIAKRLGGFEKIENLYYGDSWSAHDLCRVTYEGTTYTYSACPSLSTGEVAIDDIFNRPMVDLTNTSALRKLTKIAS